MSAMYCMFEKINVMCFWIEQRRGFEQERRPAFEEDYALLCSTEGLVSKQNNVLLLSQDHILLLRANSVLFLEQN